MGIFGKSRKELSESGGGVGNYVAPAAPGASQPSEPPASSAAAATTSTSQTATTSQPTTAAKVLPKKTFETGDPDVLSRNGAKDVETGGAAAGSAGEKATTSGGKTGSTTLPSSGGNAPAPIPYGHPDSPASFEETSVISRGSESKQSTGIAAMNRVGSGDSDDSAFTITRNGQYLTLNGFANGHLMRWKFAAEEGPAFIRIPAVLLALACIVTTAFPLVAYEGFWTIPLIICAIHTWILSLLIIVLEARVIGIRDPTNCRARVRGVITRYINVTRLVWGRGLLYIYCGSMNLTIDDRYVIYSAFPMMILGILAVGTGAHASYNLDRMKSSLTDEAFLWSKFETNDRDGDNKIDVNGFAELLWSLGLEFDDVYTFKAFQQIDKQRKGIISFEQFKQWWIVTQNDGRRLKN